ncbi:MAG: hypothetical protein A2W09_01465 [Deltaproteobacteria bacterium RBG_16_50_11]|nr:MAG: hypothetical protein A2W09_01465 [Deltaproteobacteria bacterium RBG_16_50_11]
MKVHYAERNPLFLSASTIPLAGRKKWSVLWKDRIRCGEEIKQRGCQSMSIRIKKRNPFKFKKLKTGGIEASFFKEDSDCLFL